jgi:hypothetical protein
MIEKYNEYVELIKEGLIRTHNIINYEGSLERELYLIGVKFEIKIYSKLKFDLTLYKTNIIDNEYLEYIVEYIQNQLGYFPSYIIVENNIGKNGFKFDKKYLSNKYKSIKITFEAKYDDGFYKNDILVPKIAYHLSSVDNEEKINRIGLCVKTHNRKGEHPERLYFFYDINECNDLLKMLKIDDKLNNMNRKYNLYEVEMNDDNIIHSDPNYDKGFYTYDSFHPKFLKIIKHNI